MRQILRSTELGLNDKYALFIALLGHVSWAVLQRTWPARLFFAQTVQIIKYERQRAKVGQSDVMKQHLSLDITISTGE